MKKVVDVELCDDRRIYTGRLIGFVDDTDFYKILTNKQIRNKIFSSETKPVQELSSHFRQLDGLRLVVATKEINKAVVDGKRLLITERLKQISIVKGQKVGMLGENDEYIEVSERID